MDTCVRKSVSGHNFSYKSCFTALHLGLHTQCSYLGYKLVNSHIISSSKLPVKLKLLKRRRLKRLYLVPWAQSYWWLLRLVTRFWRKAIVRIEFLREGLNKMIKVWTLPNLPVRFLPDFPVFFLNCPICIFGLWEYEGCLTDIPSYLVRMTGERR